MFTTIASVYDCDKTNKMTVHPAKTQISLGINPVWSESSLCAQWVAKDPSFLHADSKDSDQTGWMPRLVWVFPGCTVILLVLSWQLIYMKILSLIRLVSDFLGCRLHKTCFLIAWLYRLLLYIKQLVQHCRSSLCLMLTCPRSCHVVVGYG